MRFGTNVLIRRDGLRAADGTPGCRRTVQGIYIGTRHNQMRVWLSRDDPSDTVGWRRTGDVGWWSRNAVSKYKK